MAAIGTRLLLVEIDGKEYSAELTNARFSSGEGENDTLTFADARKGGSREITFNFTAVQDVTNESLWSQIFEHAGDTVPLTYMPYGNAVPTAEQPHFTNTVTIAAFDGDFLGGEANASATAKWTFESAWQCEGMPVKKIAAG